MRIFVTGASGYAGYHAAIRLSQRGHTVIGLVRHPQQERLRLLRINQVEILTGDLYDIPSYRDVIETCDVVIHTMLDKKRLAETDRTMFAALESLPQRAVKRRFIYTTGCSIFGKVGLDLIDETVEPNPEHPLAFRRELEKEAVALKNVVTTVVRPGFMYGFDGFNSVSTDWFTMAREGNPVFRGDRTKGWSWIHIADLAEAYRLVLEANEKLVAGEIFHLGDDLRPLCIDVMRACVRAAGWNGDIRFEGSKKGDNISTWFDQNEFINSRKANRILGWQPRHPGVITCAPQIYKSWRAVYDTNA